MQPRCSTWQRTVRVLAVIAMLASWGLTSCADPPKINSDSPKPLPMALVESWKQAGAEVCWLRADKPVSTGDSGLGFLSVVPKQDGRAGDLPTFRFVDWQDGRLAKLSAPAEPFGLYLSETPVTDAGLKELAGLKRLQTLFLYSTHVTDAGLKELAGLEGLQALYLGRTQVTGAGLQELAALKSLQTLNLCATAVTDAWLKELAGLESLQTLNLNATKVTDAGLKELTGLKNLQTLHLNSTAVTDAGLKELTRLKNLQRLDLGGAPVTNAGLKELAGLASLQALILPRTKVTDAGLKELAGLKNLQILNVRGTKVTDAGLKDLAGRTTLRILNLSYTQVSDVGLTELTGLKNLQSLNLKLTPVTDAGLKELVGLTSLQNLDLDSTKVTDAGLRELRKALPDCKILGPSVPDEGKDSSAAPAEQYKAPVQEFSEARNLHFKATTDEERAMGVARVEELLLTRAKKLKEVMDTEKLSWRSFVIQDTINATWHEPGTPMYYVIDQLGVIRYKWGGSPGEKAIDTALEKLIKEAEGNGKNAPK